MDPASVNSDLPRNGQKLSRLQQTQRQVDEVVGVMRNNVEIVMERHGRLENLDDRASNLVSAAGDFARSGTRLRKKMWWENMKMKLCIGGIIIVVIIIIIVVIVEETKSDSTGGGGSIITTTTASIQS